MGGPATQSWLGCLFSVAVWSGALIVAPEAGADVVAQVTFDANEAGWSATFGAANSGSGTFNAGDGNPAGSLRTQDRSDLEFTWYFVSANSPSSSLYGDMSAAYGGSFTYDLKRFNDPGTEYYVESGATVYDVRLSGVIDADMNGSFETSLTLGFGSASLTPGTIGAWHGLSIPLVASAGWFRDQPSGTDPAATELQLQQVLLNVRYVEIRGNYTLANGDITGLDNVAFNSPVIVPETSGGVLVGAVTACTAGAVAARRWGREGRPRTPSHFAS